MAQKIINLIAWLLEPKWHSPLLVKEDEKIRLDVK